jgi:hypothetical protein
VALKAPVWGREALLLRVVSARAVSCVASQIGRMAAIRAGCLFSVKPLPLSQAC